MDEAKQIVLFGLLPFAATESSLPYLALGVFLNGLGIGMTSVPPVSVGYGAVPREALT